MQVHQAAVPSIRHNAAAAPPTLRYAIGDSVLGRFLVAVSSHGIAAILFGDNTQALTEDLRRRFVAEQRDDAVTLKDMVSRIAALIAMPGKSHDLPLDPVGSDFQRQVWQALRRIPAGETASYAEIARAIGRPTAMRAVAQACGANPIAVAIPCHRVVRSDGGQGGYRWGIARKAMLLRAEAAL